MSRYNQILLDKDTTKIRQLIDGSKPRQHFVADNFASPTIHGYYKGVEISQGTMMGDTIIGVTFTTNHYDPLFKKNRPFFMDEIDQVRPYIDKGLSVEQSLQEGN